MDDKDLQHLAAIVRDSDDAIMGKTLEGIITSWNWGAERIYGYTAEEAIGRTVAMLMPSDREDELPEILRRLTEGQRISNYDTLRVTKDGSVVNISLTVSPIRDACGVITGASSIGRDVTKVKEAETALRESARAYRLLMEQASDAILVSYPDQPLIEVNQRASDMLGYTREELLQLRGHGSTVPESLSVLPLLPDKILEGEIVYAEHPVRRKDGTVIVTELSARRLDDGRIMTIAREVTDRKRAEEALVQSEKRLVEAQKLAHVGSWEWDLVSDEAIGSAEMLRLLGLQPLGGENRFTIQSFIECLQPEDREWVQQALAKAVEERGSINYENRIVSPDGTVRIIHGLGEVILDEAGQPVKMIGTARDITESKHAEEALKESESRLRSALDLAQSACYEWDPQTNALKWDKGLREIWGISPDTAVDNDIFLAGVHPDDREAVQAEITRCSDPAGDGMYIAEFRVIGQHDKVERWVSSRGKTFFEDNVAVHHVGVSQEITERKRAEEAVVRSEAELRALFAAMTDVVLVLDAQGRYLQIAPTSSNLLYKPPAELLGRTMHEVLPVAEADNILRLIRQALEEQQPVHVEYSLPIGDNELWFDGTASPMGEDKVFWIARDITERKQTDASLHLSSEILQRVKSLVLVSGKDGLITYASPSVKSMLGYEPEEMLGDGWWHHTSSDPEDGKRERSHIVQLTAPATIVPGEPYERMIKSKSGELHCILWQDVKGPGDQLIGVGHDITERSRTVAARTARDAADRANQAKSEFLSRMSHELRTPLNAILGFSQILQMDSSTPEQQESVSYILKAGRHLLSLINEVLDISRIEEGRLTISMEPVFLRDVLQESLDLVQPLAARRNIEVMMDLGWMDNCHVMADRQRLQQVLWNLLANAIKYNREGGIVKVSCSESSCKADGVQQRQEPESQQAQARIRISVSDTGLGLSPDMVARLFTPFERLGAEQGDVEGTGLGLALSKHLVEAMGGDIGVESEQGRGSTFWVELSTADEQMPGLELLVTRPLFNIQVEEQARTMLYIEDNLSNLRLIEHILRKRPGINLITAMQGQMGLVMAQEHRPDLILLDLHLPDMTGHEVLRQLREDPRTAFIPVVVLSADANPRQVERLLAAGAQDYLTKPLDVEHLLKVLGETPARKMS